MNIVDIEIPKDILLLRSTDKVIEYLDTDHEFKRINKDFLDIDSFKCNKCDLIIYVLNNFNTYIPDDYIYAYFSRYCLCGIDVIDYISCKEVIIRKILQ